MINRRILSSFLTSVFFEIFIKKAKGITKRTFAIFDPIILPNVIPCNPFKAALTEIANSGAEVPNATKVTAITKGCTFKCLARATDPLTKYSPLKYNIIMPSNR